MIKFLKSITFTNWVVVLLTFFYTYTVSNLGFWNREGRIFVHDVAWHYEFLPAHFIYGDVTFENLNENEQKFSPNFMKMNAPLNGKKFIKTSMGLAILYSPFFAIAHIHSKFTCQDISGYSKPYKLWFVFGSVFYFLIGIIFLKKTLQKHFTNTATALTILAIGIGTNLYHYTVLAVGMPHLYVFSLLSIMIYLLDQWYEKSHTYLIASVGVIFSLLVLIRPIFIVFLPLVIFWNLKKQTIKNRLFFLAKNSLKLLFSFFLAFVVWIPQFMYWKEVSGHYVFFPYVGESFFFSRPYILNCLIGYRKGWLLYTPIMIFSIIGFYHIIKKDLKNGLLIILTCLLYFYVCSCWWVWWFGGSMGWRPMIDVYPLLAFSFCAFIEYVLVEKGLLKKGVFIISTFFIILNLLYTRQYHEGILHHDSMTGKAYWHIFFKLKGQIDKNKLNQLYDHPNYKKALLGDRNK